MFMPCAAAQVTPEGAAVLPLLSQPVVEVAAFRVAPVAAAASGAADARLKNVAPVVTSAAPGEKTQRVIELRTQKGDIWDDLLPRVASLLAAKLPAGAAQAQQVAMPPLLPGKFLRAKLLPDDALEIE